jgi:nucleotidyltransferase/DNA polymerase involved in DNA repair
MACDYNLTGGHISNIRKKLTMRTLLEPALSIDECAIELCEQEFVLRSNTGLRTISGFSLPKTQSDSLNN